MGADDSGLHLLAHDFLTDIRHTLPPPPTPPLFLSAPKYPSFLGRGTHSILISHHPFLTFRYDAIQLIRLDWAEACLICETECIPRPLLPRSLERRFRDCIPAKVGFWVFVRRGLLRNETDRRCGEGLTPLNPRPAIPHPMLHPSQPNVPSHTAKEKHPGGLGIRNRVIDRAARLSPTAKLCVYSLSPV